MYHLINFITLVYQIIYIVLMTSCCLAVFIVSLWPRFDKPKYRKLRGILFIILGLLAIAPMAHIVFVYET